MVELHFIDVLAVFLLHTDEQPMFQPFLLNHIELPRYQLGQRRIFILCGNAHAALPVLDVVVIAAIDLVFCKGSS
jgi:hypothetical protein